MHILSHINPIPHIDLYFFEIYSNIFLLLRLRLPRGLSAIGYVVYNIYFMLFSIVFMYLYDQVYFRCLYFIISFDLIEFYLFVFVFNIWNLELI